MLSFEHSVLSM